MKRVWLPGSSLGSIISIIPSNSESLWSWDNWFPLNVTPVRLLQEWDNQPLQVIPRPQQTSETQWHMWLGFHRPFAGPELEHNMREIKNPSINTLQTEFRRNFHNVKVAPQDWRTQRDSHPTSAAFHWFRTTRTMPIRKLLSFYFHQYFQLR